MNFGVFIPIVAILASAWVLTSILRYWALGRQERNSDGEAAARELAGENERLKGQVSRLEERLAVLERIATDPAERTAREIENLR
jgi:hypothetical protein